MVKQVSFLTIILLCSVYVLGQDNAIKDTTVYHSHTIKDYRIEKLDKSYSSSFELEGFRIQIFSGNKKQPARQARLKFKQKHKDIEAHESYQVPYFKVRVGDFKTKLEALKFQKEISTNYPNCFIVKDKIDYLDTNN